MGRTTPGVNGNRLRSPDPVVRSAASAPRVEARQAWSVSTASGLSSGAKRAPKNPPTLSPPDPVCYLDFHPLLGPDWPLENLRQCPRRNASPQRAHFEYRGDPVDALLVCHGVCTLQTFGDGLQPLGGLRHHNEEVHGRVVELANVADFQSSLDAASLDAARARCSGRRDATESGGRVRSGVRRPGAPQDRHSAEEEKLTSDDPRHRSRLAPSRRGESSDDGNRSCEGSTLHCRSYRALRPSRPDPRLRTRLAEASRRRPRNAFRGPNGPEAPPALRAL